MSILPNFRKENIENYYELREAVGSGRSARVKVCVDKVFFREYAAKFIKKRVLVGTRRGASAQEIQNEVTTLLQLDHENIIKLYEVFDTTKEIVLILERVSGGELFQYLADKEKLSEDEATAFLKQILNAVKHMHGRNIAHLDLKPENVMLQSRNSPKIKIIDFGLSRSIEDGKDIKDMVGTPEFVAPEVINFEPLGLSTDMWSIGVLTYIMLSGASPFLGETLQDTYRNIATVSYNFDVEFFPTTSELAKDFIKKLLVKDPWSRMTAGESLLHAFIEPKQEEEKSLRMLSCVNVEKLKCFMARKRWRQSLSIVSLCNFLTKATALQAFQSTSCSTEEMHGGNSAE